MEFVGDIGCSLERRPVFDTFLRVAGPNIGRFLKYDKSSLAIPLKAILARPKKMTRLFWKIMVVLTDGLGASDNLVRGRSRELWWVPQLLLNLCPRVEAEKLFPPSLKTACLGMVETANGFSWYTVGWRDWGMHTQAANWRF